MQNKTEKNKNEIQLASLEKHLQAVGHGVAPLKFQMHERKIVKVFGRKILKKKFSQNVGASEAGLRSLPVLKNAEEKKENGYINVGYFLDNGKVQEIIIETELELDFDGV